MKSNLFVFFIVLCFVTAVSCKKTTSPYATTTYVYLVNGGATGFDQNLVLFSSSDTLTFNIIIAASFTLTQSVPVGLEAADTARRTYNSTYGTSYLGMPTDAYRLLQSSGEIVAGKSSDTIQIQFYKKALEGSTDNYLLPVLLTGGGGNTLLSTSSIIYFHYVGNATGGYYTVSGKRYIYAGPASDNNVLDSIPSPEEKTLIPETDGTSSVDYGDLGLNGWQYNFIYSAQGELTAVPNSTILNSVYPNSFKMLDFQYDSIGGTFYLKSSYLNSTGDERVVEETLTKE